jgi:NAD(P)-dependent dehydrogenase (short-subunit alcohol dehydrogenase family)
VINLNGETAQALADELNIKSGEVTAAGFACDITSKESAEECCAEVLQRFGHVDVLVNGAGGNRYDANTSAERSEIVPCFRQ